MNDMNAFNTVAHGGPLFLKVLLDQVTINSESVLRSFLQLIKTCEIKGNDANKSENTDKVVEELRRIIKAVFALKEGQAPEDLVLDLLRIFQTTGAPTFNNHFVLFENDCRRASIHRSIDPDCKSDGPVTSNNEDAALCVLTFAEKACWIAVENAEWDKCLNQEPGKAAFVQQSPPTPTAPPAALPPA